MTDRVVVVGLGIMGAQALLHLAEAGVDCIGIESRSIGHPHGGSSGGATRIFRTRWNGQHHDALEYGLQRWSALRHAGAPVLSPIGALTIGHLRDPRMGELLTRCGDTSTRRSTGVSMWRSEAIRERWPRLRVEPEEVGVLDERGGLLHAHSAVMATVALARQLGAEVLEGTTVTEVRDEGAQLRVVGEGQDWRASRVVCTTGGVPVFWPKRDECELAVSGRRVALAWFEPDEPAPDPVSDVGSATPGMRFLEEQAAISFVPPVDEWGWKVNHMPTSRPPASAATHPALAAAELAAVQEAAHATVGGLRAGVARVETYVEWYSTSGGPCYFSQADGRLTAVTGFSGNGFRLAPSVGASLAAAL